MYVAVIWLFESLAGFFTFAFTTLSYLGVALTTQTIILLARKASAIAMIGISISAIIAVALAGVALVNATVAYLMSLVSFPANFLAVVAFIAPKHGNLILTTLFSYLAILASMRIINIQIKLFSRVFN